MATMLTLLDLAKRHGSAAEVGLIEEAQKYCPEVNIFPARRIKGVNYKTLCRTSYATAGFRSANEGVAASKSTFENRMFSCHILSSLVVIDQAVADGHEDGPEVCITLEADGKLQSAFKTIGTQIFYGTPAADTEPGDPKGFAGFVNQVDSSMVVDAGGSTADTGSSVWAVRLGWKFCHLLFGGSEKPGGPLKASAVTSQLIDVNNDGKLMPAYCLNLQSLVGLQVGSIHSVGRIKNLTEEPGKGLTDALMVDLLSKFPDGMPDAIFMTRRSRLQLKNSRTATSIDGKPAPFPTEFYDIPIFPTDSLLDTEAIS